LGHGIDYEYSVTYYSSLWDVGLTLNICVAWFSNATNFWDMVLVECYHFGDEPQIYLLVGHETYT
jgi:hypothetical protein